MSATRAARVAKLATLTRQGMLTCRGCGSVLYLREVDADPTRVATQAVNQGWTVTGAPTRQAVRCAACVIRARAAKPP